MNDTALLCRFLPDQDEASRLEGQDRFELAAPEEKPARQYGLQQRKPAAAAEPSEPSTATPVGTEGAPAGLRHMARPQHDSAAENGDARGPAWMQARRAGRGVMQDAEADILRCEFTANAHSRHTAAHLTATTSPCTGQTLSNCISSSSHSYAQEVITC